MVPTIHCFKSYVKRKGAEYVLGFLLRRKIAGSRELGAWSLSHRGRDVRRSDVRHQTVMRMLGFFVRHKIAGSLEPGARHIDVETSDGQTSDIRLSRAYSAFFSDAR